MKIKIEFYGRLKTEFSQEPIEFEIMNQSSNPTLEFIFFDLCKKYDVTPNTNIIKPILNDTFAEWSDTVKTNDAVGFFPPASGG